MRALKDAIRDSEQWLMRQILNRAEQKGYTRYSSTLEEAWRLSIEGLSQSLFLQLESSEEVAETGISDESGPLVDFAVYEAKAHRRRGVPLEMFLGLMKHYRNCYLDLCEEKLPRDEQSTSRQFILNCFDRIEVAFCKEWGKVSDYQMRQELQTANRLLTNEKNAYLTIFESLNDPVLMVDRQGNIINMNHAASKLVGGDAVVPGRIYYNEDAPTPDTRINPVELKLTSALPWIPHEVLQPYENARFRTQAIEIEIEGKIRYFEVVVGNLLDISEKYTATIVTLHDDTELREAAKLREQAIATRDRFSSIISHDLLNPFNALLGMTSILSEHYDEISEEERLKMITHLQKSSERLYRTARNLLDWANLQSNRIECNPVLFDANELIEDVMNFLFDSAKQKNIRVRFENLSSGKMMVWADRQMIETVLRNIVGNAIKFTPAGGTICIQAELSNTSVWISVSDSGVGIPDSVLAQLFNKERLVSTAGTSGERGTGLGLKLCAEFIDRNNGTIEVRSNEGHGSCFRFSLPVKSS